MKNEKPQDTRAVQEQTAPTVQPANRRASAHQQVIKLVQLALLTAVVLVLQFTGVGIKLPIPGTTNISLVLIPIALGAMLLGPAAGAFLGFVFGAVVYVTGGVMHMDFFTGFLFDNHPVITAGICLIKSTLAGFLGGWVYRVVRGKNTLLAVFLAAGIVPLVNTGVFVIGCLCILDTIEALMAAAGIAGQTAVYFIFIGCAGLNFVCEFAVNMILSPALERILRIVGRKIRK